MLAGVLGGGKISTAEQFLSIYIEMDCSPNEGLYGNYLGTELENIRSKPLKLKKQRR